MPGQGPLQLAAPRTAALPPGWLTPPWESGFREAPAHTLLALGPNCLPLCFFPVKQGPRNQTSMSQRAQGPSGVGGSPVFPHAGEQQPLRPPQPSPRASTARVSATPLGGMCSDSPPLQTPAGHMARLPC
ncbi:unnamed protein product [Rangifer tarandus platyrhynchus]|uniref:Uncharacterized protein n=2 Tax=Rangifer tarandus platyrhynchus TaxID=3082113 RepID=A0AC59ZVI2_RANTA|nr:unnamed protein product [Rangifer tarandus platyrhynchus]